jgi:predicted nucleic acid-binding protein
MSGGRCFFDTNVLVYLFATDEPEKQGRARHLLARTGEDGEIVLSAQVLQELFVTVTRKSAVQLSPAEAEAAVERFAKLRVVVADAPLVLAAARRSRVSKISFWDALIVEAARVAGCGTLYSEDLQHGWQIDEGLRVINPFAEGSTSGRGPAQPGR